MEILVVVFVTGIASILTVAIQLLLGRRKNSAGGGLPYRPASWPIVGSLPSMLLHGKPYFKWALRVASDRDLTYIRLGKVQLVIVNCPKLACKFLCYPHDVNFSSRPITLSSGISSRDYLSAALSPSGEQWKKMRRVVVRHVVNNTTLRSQADLRRKEADHLIDYIRNQWREIGGGKDGEGVAIDIRLASRYYVISVMKMIAFGQRHFGEEGRFGGPGKEDVDHVDALLVVLSHTYAFCISDYLPSLRFLDIGRHERTVREKLAVVDNYHDAIIDDRFAKWDAGERNVKGDVLDALISLRDEEDEDKPLLTKEEIKSQINELMEAAIDNPTNVVEWAIAHLLNQPELLNKAVEELDRVVGKDRLVEESDLPSLPYIKAIARESLRLHPVVPFNLPHVAIADTTVDNYFIPKDSWVLLSRPGLGRNPAVWTDPMVFNPDRHVGPDIDLAEPNLRFISFSTGRRSCPGGALGSILTHICLARLLQAFEWSITNLGVDLSEEDNGYFMRTPLRATARPRLPILK